MNMLHHGDYSGALENLHRYFDHRYDYSGYGQSTGKPSEQHTYADIDVACQCLVERYGVKEEDVRLYGQSVGSGINKQMKLGELEAEHLEMNANDEKLQHSYNELIEYKLVLLKAAEFFHSAFSTAAQKAENEACNSGDRVNDSPLLREQEMMVNPSNQFELGFISGLVPGEKSMAFERILFRATRGNVFLKQGVLDNPIVDPASGHKEPIMYESQ